MQVQRKLLALWAACLLCVIASTSFAATITRSTKASGGTAFVDGNIILASEVNADFDVIVNLVNGNIDTNNLSASAGIVSGQILDGTLLNADVNASAAIAYSKFSQTAAQQDADIVDDFSATEPEMVTVTSPGITGTASLATNLEEELARLRYAIKRLAVGVNAKYTSGAATMSWIDGPVRGGNLSFNGSFEVKASASPAAPDGWALVGVPTTVEQAETAVTLGEGKEIHIVARASNIDGISQTYAGLKASSQYLVMVYAKAATVSDTCGLITTGATGTFGNLALTTSATTYTPLVGYISTDTTPTNIVVSLVAAANAQADDCDYDQFGVYSVDADVMHPSGSVAQSIRKTSNQTFSSASYTAFTSLSTVITVPGPGYWIETTADFALERAAGSSNVNIGARIQENGTTCAIKERTLTTTTEAVPISMSCVNTAPTPGTTYTYTTDAKITADSAGSCDTANEGDCRITTRLVRVQ